MTNEKMELLIADARANPNWEATKAEAMFRKFIAGRFSYDELSRHPDYPTYASAEVLAVILPLIIDEMLARTDSLNYLIYPLITAVDPFGNGHAAAVKRTEELEKLVDHKFVAKVLQLLEAIEDDPPVEDERLQMIIAFWKNKHRKSI